MTTMLFQRKFVALNDHNMDIGAGGDTCSGVEPLELVISAYKVYQDTLKHPDSTSKVDTCMDEGDVSPQRLLADAYHKYTCYVAVSVLLCLAPCNCCFFCFSFMACDVFLREKCHFRPNLVESDATIL